MLGSASESTTCKCVNPGNKLKLQDKTDNRIVRPQGFVFGVVAVKHCFSRTHGDFN